jgi:hypothetical protein
MLVSRTGGVSASYAGLTRVSIILQRVFSKEMDCRVKPGNDGWALANPPSFAI